MILSRNTRAAHLAERAEFLRTLRRHGPDAPTLCDAWSTQRLAAHVVVSEQWAGLPLAVAYPLWRVLPARTADALRTRSLDTGERMMDKGEARGWDWLLRRLEHGPPRAFGLRLVAELRIVEDWIHHEDVRRANGEAPRPAEGALAEALVAGGRTLRRFDMFAASRRGIEAVLPDGRTFRLGDGEPTVWVRGDPGEVVLWLAGRGDAAMVDVEGDVPETALRV